MGECKQEEHYGKNIQTEDRDEFCLACHDEQLLSSLKKEIEEERVGKDDKIWMCILVKKKKWERIFKKRGVE